MIKVFLESIVAYNNGATKGRWITLPMTEDDLRDEIKDILDGDEEYFITDWECEFFSISQYDNISILNEKAEYLSEKEDYELAELKAICELVDFDEAKDILEKGNYFFIPDVSSETELGEYVIDEGLFGIDIPDSLKNYIDYEAIGRDWLMDYNLVEGGAINIC
ncbi:MAG: antirestriction protein ArdA [Clostridium butyricum]